ncbi:farnesyl diphosphate synthase [Arboricoccus pini]|uniref:Farnesyl diphosphate synthase n=2 Tax=Arboricoccus pini TaxID=1963835 RepID=A0A212QN53_9PROT|nr:farnesyl diphosphate synthase [Arboricoccus pini]
MARVAADIERELDRLLSPTDTVPPRLLEAMRYACLEAGKRFRPILVHAGAALGHVDRASITRVGAAIELVHCYSLVHDDLPAMDDAELRRGKPSVHRQFGEATAILAGDALNALAMEVLARADWPAAAPLRLELVVGLGRAAGAAGMCGGQMLDLESSSERLLSEEELVQLQRLKTGALIGFSLEAGARLAGLDAAALRALTVYADALGLAFQIRDDLLDLEVGETGKMAGRDAALGRKTFVTLLGAPAARARLIELRQQGWSALSRAKLETNLLGQLFDFVIDRSS